MVILRQKQSCCITSRRVEGKGCYLVASSLNLQAEFPADTEIRLFYVPRFIVKKHSEIAGQSHL